MILPPRIRSYSGPKCHFCLGDTVRNVYSYMCAQYIAPSRPPLRPLWTTRMGVGGGVWGGYPKNRKYVARVDDAVRSMYSYIYAQYIARDDVYNMMLCMLICICCA